MTDCKCLELDQTFNAVTYTETIRIYVENSHRQIGKNVLFQDDNGFPHEFEKLEINRWPMFPLSLDLCPIEHA